MTQTDNDAFDQIRAASEGEKKGDLPVTLHKFLSDLFSYAKDPKTNEGKDVTEVSDKVWAFGPRSLQVRVFDFAPKSADFCATSLLNHFLPSIGKKEIT